jgi:hypothetical protein
MTVHGLADVQGSGDRPAGGLRDTWVQPLLDLTIVACSNISPMMPSVSSIIAAPTSWVQARVRPPMIEISTLRWRKSPPTPRRPGTADIEMPNTMTAN